MTECDLARLEEYSPDKFLIKPVYDGARSKAKLLHLLPAQQVPVHPHPDLEVTLFPQRGAATLIWEDGREEALAAGTVYCPGVGATFGLRNDGLEPFQTLVLLVPGAGEPAR